jgi:hypothetical protein
VPIVLACEPFFRHGFARRSGALLRMNAFWASEVSGFHRLPLLPAEGIPQRQTLAKMVS